MVGMDTDSAAHAADSAAIEAIHQVVATVEHSQQNKDPDEFLALMAVLLSFPADSRCNVIRRLRAGARAIFRRGEE